jgi:Kef-type K+ transport system membrane component KefB
MAADAIARLLLQLAVIVAAGRVAARLLRPALQPAVVGEMAAGVLLGPTLLGWLAPVIFRALFPPESFALLSAAAQVGVVLYMFCVGLEFRADLFSATWRSAAAVSWSGIAAPLALGAWLGLRLHAAGGYFPPALDAGRAALLTGVALSVTAFPVLARIVAERGLSGTRAGALALGAGACDDAAAWVLLAVLLGTLDGSTRGAALALGGGAAFAAFTLLVARPAAAALAERAGPGALGPGGLAWALAALAAAAWTTEALGLHAVFGAFLAGLAAPRGAFARRARERIEPLTAAVLVPAFFACAGLRTRVALLDSPERWAAAALVLVVAVAAKGLACAFAARAAGSTRPEAFAVGALMNARGLMELILLDIALRRGLATPTLYSILALTALATTVAAGPALELVRPALAAAAAGVSGAERARRRGAA